MSESYAEEIAWYADLYVAACDPELRGDLHAEDMAELAYEELQRYTVDADHTDSAVDAAYARRAAADV